MAVFFAAAAWRGWLAPWWIALPVVAFIALVAKHDAVIRARNAAARAIAFYERGLARIDDRWAGGGETGERFRDASHLYGPDLDLFGPASLFELLSIARTRAGEDTLASWLLAPADGHEIRSRQEAVEELTPRLDLREALSLAGSDIRAGVHTEALVSWAEAPPLLTSTWLRGAAAALTMAAIVTATIWTVVGTSTPFVLVVMLEIAFAAPLRARVTKALHGADAAGPRSRRAVRRPGANRTRVVRGSRAVIAAAPADACHGGETPGRRIAIDSQTALAGRTA
jgi:hypothetical protein